MRRCGLLIVLAMLSAPSRAADDAVGPQTAKVLWVHKGAEHFVASPVAGSKELYVSSLGAFNTGNFYALSLDPAAKERVLWAKTPPYLKLPVVSAPATMQRQVIFGDGMHQTDGATLRSVETGSGRLVWEYAVPGELVHMEGTPAIAGSKVYMGGGNAGVFCVDADQLTFQGKQQTSSAIAAELDKLWKQELARYEEEKKNDPDLAVPPSADTLPKPMPKLVWQQGKGQWHVDAGVTVAGDKILVASSLLETEKIGDRAIYCLSAADGSTKWKCPLKYNPWGAPRVVDGLVLVSSSTIRFDPQQIKKGRGEVVAIELADGKIRWRKEVFGGIVSSLAVRPGMTISTATDGRVQAYDLEKGKLAWGYPGGSPFFAGPTVAGPLVYAADLKGVVHALGVDDGKLRWKFDVGADPAVAAPGMVYGTPLAHEGRLYMATCNLDGGEGKRPGAVVCLGEK